MREVGLRSVQRRRKAAVGVASAAVVAAALGAPMAGFAQQPPVTTTATTPDPAPTQTTTEPAVPETVFAAPQDAPPEPAPDATPAPAPPGPPPGRGNPPPLFMPGLPRTSVKPVAPLVAPEPAPPDHNRRKREDVLGTNRDPGDETTGAPAGDAGLGTALAATGAADVPSFFIDSFAVPPFLLPIYQAAGIEYGVPWQVLAAINAVETDYGRNLRVSSAGAVGWMQFLPATFARYGVDGNGDGRADPYNPIDAIFSAAGYLQAAGAGTDLAAAVFAYNHSQAYVSDVLMRARLLGGLPADLVAALSGLAQGRPPVAGQAEALATPASSTTLRLRTAPGATIIAVADGTVMRIGSNARLGRYLRLRDGFGTTYTYGGLARTARRYPVLSDAGRAPRLPAPRPAPAPPRAAIARSPIATPRLATTNWEALAQRPAAPRLRPPDRAPQLKGYDRRLLAGVPAREVAYRPLRSGSRVIAGTVLAYAGRADAASGRLAFEIRPAGAHAPQIQPRPVVAGWKLLQRSARRASLVQGAPPAGIGRVLLLGKRELQRTVLEDSRITIYACGRDDIRAGRVDRRVLAALKFLALSGLSPTVSALQCGHGLVTSPGEPAADARGAGVDITAVNGIPIAGNQGPGSIAEATIRRLLGLQGALRPQQIASLFTVAGATNTVALPDHADRIHIGFTADTGDATLAGRQSDGVVPASSWRRLSRRLGRIANPRVSSPGARP